MPEEYKYKISLLTLLVYYFQYHRLGNYILFLNINHFSLMTY